MAGMTVTKTLEIQHDSLCRGHFKIVDGGGVDETTLIDLSADIKLKGHTVDSNGLMTGGIRPLGIKLYSIKGHMVGNITISLEAKGVIADELIKEWKNNPDTYFPIDEDFRKSPSGGFKRKCSEVLIGDTDWDQQANVTATQDTTVRKVGVDSVKLAIAAGFTTGLLASDEITAADISGYDAVGFWIRSSVALQPSDLSFLLDNTASCASPIETLPIPIALAADKWRWVELQFATPSLLTAIVSMGLRSDRDFGAASVYIDGIRVKKLANNRVASAIGDLVATPTGFASGDTLDLEIEFGLIWSADSYHGVLV